MKRLVYTCMIKRLSNIGMFLCLFLYLLLCLFFWIYVLEPPVSHQEKGPYYSYTYSHAYSYAYLFICVLYPTSVGRKFC